MRIVMIVAAALLGWVPAASAQTSVAPLLPTDPAPAPEVRSTTGALIPTGSHRELFAVSAAYGLQVGLGIGPTLHVVGAFAWSAVETALDVSDPRVTVLQYDAGAELDLLRLMRPLEPGRDVRPFAGFGAGARSYRYAADELDTYHPLTAYGSAGVELRRSTLALRAEVRDYVLVYRHPLSEKGRTLSEVALSLGVVYRFGR